MNLQELISKLKEKQKPETQAFLEKIKNWRDNNGNKNC